MPNFIPEKSSVVKKTTKKSAAAEKAALKSFDNMVSGITSVTPAFIKTNIESLNRVTLSASGKKHVVLVAKAVVHRASENAKIQLPAEWDSLLTYDQV